MTEAYTAFDGHSRIASGPMAEVALSVKRAIENGAADPIQIYADATGRAIDIDTRGTDAEIVARFTRPVEPRGRGRPKLGVVAREVTLLPRHWDWLNRQSGGASVALRKLVEEASRANGDRQRKRAAQDAAYGFMSAMAGDMPNFEEAARALYAGNNERLEELIADWPGDVRAHALKLASV